MILQALMYLIISFNDQEGDQKEIFERSIDLLLKFDNDNEKKDRMIMINKLLTLLKPRGVALNRKVTHDVIYIYIDALNWRQLAETLRYLTSDTCDITKKSVDYIKEYTSKFINIIQESYLLL